MRRNLKAEDLGELLEGRTLADISPFNFKA